MTLDEQLSALLDGDLAPEEADALRARIDADPDLAERWDELCALVADLDRLTLPELDDSLVARAAARPDPPPVAAEPANRVGATVLWAVVAAAAGVVLGLMAPREPVTVHVDPDWVRIDGPASLSMDGRTEPVTSPTHIPRTPNGAVTIGTSPRLTAPAPTTPDLQELRIRLERSQRRTERLEDELSVLRGRVVAHEGRPLAWPTDLPDLLQPDAFDATVRGLLEDHPTIELRAVDCSEFPCAVVLYERQDIGEGRDWRAIFYPLTDRLPEPWSVLPAVRDTELDLTRHEVAVIAVLDPAFADANEQRLMFRVRELLEVFQPEVMRE